MGLDVYVFKAIIPADKLDTIEKVAAFESKNECSFHTTENCPAIFGSKFEVEIPREEYDWEKAFRDRGLNEADFIWYEYGCDFFKFIPSKIYHEISGNAYTYEVAEKDIVIFKTSEIPTHIVRVKGFFCKNEELGYQRKGANAQFYKDGKWDDNTVVIDRKTVLDDWEKYFSDEDDAYYGENAKQHFKENIIDNFVDGETIVCYR